MCRATARRWAKSWRARQCGHARLLQRSGGDRGGFRAAVGSTRATRAVVHPDGYVEIRDRFKDVIISGGENISSIEVEGALLRHPAVLEAAVVGMPHEKWGETPHAFVVLRAETSCHARPTCIDFARERARALQGPERVSFRERIAEDRDRKNPEIRAAGKRPAISRQ